MSQCPPVSRMLPSRRPIIGHVAAYVSTGFCASACPIGGPEALCFVVVCLSVCACVRDQAEAFFDHLAVELWFQPACWQCLPQIRPHPLNGCQGKPLKLAGGGLTNQVPFKVYSL